jgi:selenocysteine lyase/cysteine desulfurase
MPTCQESRKYFPYLETGKKYFNHAAISPLPTRVIEKLDDYIQIRSETDIEPYFETLSQATGAKDKLAKLLNVNSALIAWSSNVSNSLNILAQGLDWKHGDEIILNNIEFPSNIYPFLNLKNKGVNILFAKDENGVVDLTQIEKLITPKTKLISISMVQFLTGYRADLKSIGELCRKNNIIFCVDGIQGVGAVQIDIVDCNIDFFAGGTHKWLMGLQGLGYFYLSEKLFDIVNQKHVGWTSVKNTWDLLDYNLNLLETADKFQIGTLPRIAIIALNSSLSLFEEIGYDRIENQIISNSAFLIELLIENGYKPILANALKENIAGIVSFTHDNSVKIVKQLESQNIICSVREGMIRISPHFYNTKEDLIHFISELKKVETKI